MPAKPDIQTSVGPRLRDIRDGVEITFPSSPYHASFVELLRDYSQHFRETLTQEPKPKSKHILLCRHANVHTVGLFIQCVFSHLFGEQSGDRDFGNNPERSLVDAWLLGQELGAPIMQNAMLRLIAQLLSAKTRDKRMETCIWAKEVLQPNNTNTKLYFYFTTVYLIAQQKSISLKDLDALNEIGAKAILANVLTQLAKILPQHSNHGYWETGRDIDEWEVRLYEFLEEEC